MIFNNVHVGKCIDTTVDTIVFWIQTHHTYLDPESEFAPIWIQIRVFLPSYMINFENNVKYFFAHKESF